MKLFDELDVLIKTKCEECGRPYTKTGRNQKYCSTDCRIIASQRRAIKNWKEYRKDSQWLKT
jgi:hypothetical protein